MYSSQVLLVEQSPPDCHQVRGVRPMEVIMEVLLMSNLEALLMSGRDLLLILSMRASAD